MTLRVRTIVPLLGLLLGTPAIAECQSLLVSTYDHNARGERVLADENCLPWGPTLPYVDVPNLNLPPQTPDPAPLRSRFQFHPEYLPALDAMPGLPFPYRWWQEQ